MTMQGLGRSNSTVCPGACVRVATDFSELKFSLEIAPPIPFMLRCTTGGASFATPPGPARHFRRIVKMNFIDGTQSHHRSEQNSAVWRTRLNAALDRFARARAERRRRARDFQALSESTDRQLRDMGINRSDVPSVINGTYRSE
jgi:uncharacterized protein YjiS (DUF1127 family)